MAGLLRSIKRVLTGHVIRRADVSIEKGTTTLSLSLKRESGTQSHYVVLAMKSAGNWQYTALNADEFRAFVKEATTICSMLETKTPG